jgi:hypothetical protein
VRENSESTLNYATLHYNLIFLYKIKITTTTLHPVLHVIINSPANAVAIRRSSMTRTRMAA